jgi:hypothetical protein
MHAETLLRSNPVESVIVKMKAKAPATAGTPMIEPV